MKMLRLSLSGVIACLVALVGYDLWQGSDGEQNRRLDDHETRIESQAGQIEKQGAEIGRHEVRLEDHQTRIERLTKELRAVEGRVHDAESRLDEAQARLESAEEDARVGKAEREELANDVQSLRDALESLQGDYAQRRQQVIELERKLQEQEGFNREVDRRLDALERREGLIQPTP